MMKAKTKLNEKVIGIASLIFGVCCFFVAGFAMSRNWFVPMFIGFGLGATDFFIGLKLLFGSPSL